jgi:hypothetical protein
MRGPARFPIFSMPAWVGLLFLAFLPGGLVVLALGKAWKVFKKHQSRK